MIQQHQNNDSPFDDQESRPGKAFRLRHPLLVLIWSIGILIVINLPQYLGALVGAVMGGLTFQSVISGQAHNLFSRLGQGLVDIFIGIPLGYLIIILLWRRSLDWMRLRLKWKPALGGFILGLILALIVVAVISLIGDVHITAGPSRMTAGEGVIILAGAIGWVWFVAFSEETVFRGIVVREWAAKWGWTAAALLGGLLFGAVHLPGTEGGLSPVSVIWILAAGAAVTAMFVALYIRGRSLWLPIGFHAGWNLCLQGILGVTISGKNPGEALLHSSVSGPNWLTGGVFGIEASLIAIIFYLLVALIALRFSFSGKPKLLNPRPKE